MSFWSAIKSCCAKRGFALAALVLANVSVLPGQIVRAPKLGTRLLETGSVVITWSAEVNNFVLESRDSFDGSATWEPVTDAPKLAGSNLELTVQPSKSSRFFRLRTVTSTPRLLFRLTDHLPADGAVDVGVTFRPKIIFSEHVSTNLLTNFNFYASAGGQVLPATIVPARDGSFAWLFFKDPLPGNALVRVTVDGSSIFAISGNGPLDADGDGQPGGVLNFDFTTVSRVELPGTSLSGVVVDPGPDFLPRTFDDFDVGPDGRFGTGDDVWLLPIAGVKVYLLGRESQIVVTGADGRFHFDSVPPGNVKVVVDGTSALNPPAGKYFPEMVLDTEIHVGLDNWTMLDDPAVYLPRLARTILKNFTAKTNLLITAQPEGATGLTEAERQRLTIEVQPGSLVGPDGTSLPSANIGVSTVPPSIVRDMLPPGVLQHTFDITVQAPGTATFSTPAPMTFPNVFNAAPGTQLNFLSFDHTSGRLVIEGTATVSDDGKSVRTDPGTGVTHPGWHGLTPPGNPMNSTNPPPGPVVLTNCFNRGLVSKPVAHPFITNEVGRLAHSELTWTGPSPGAGLALTVNLQIDGPLAKFMKKTGNLDLRNQSFTLSAGAPQTMTLSATAKTYTEMFGRNSITNFAQDELYGASITVTEILELPGGCTETTRRKHHLFRLINVTELNTATIRFRKTLADGDLGPYQATKTLVASLPKKTDTEFSLLPKTGAPPSLFATPGLFSVNGVLLWSFNPPRGGKYSQELSIQVDDGANTEVGHVLLTGTGIEPVKVNPDIAGFKAELKRVVLGLYAVTGTDGLEKVLYPFNVNNTNLPPVVKVQVKPGGEKIYVLNTVLNGSFGRDLGPDQIQGTRDDVVYLRFRFASAKFKQLFQGFMPKDRAIKGPDGIDGSPDDMFSPAQLAALDQLINQQGSELLAALRQDYAPVNDGIMAVDFVDSGGDVVFQWADLFNSWIAVNQRIFTNGTAAFGAPLYGYADVDRNHGRLQSDLSSATLPLGARFFSLAENLNASVTNSGFFAVAINLDWNSGATLAQYIANTVSHELGHTFGLLDAYTDAGRVGGTARCDPSRNCLPFDIMRSGQTTDADLTFAPGNVALLQMALGVNPGQQEAMPWPALDQFRRTFNLTLNENGIRENTPLEPPPTEPEIVAFSGLNSFFGEANELPLAFEQTFADGPGNAFSEKILTVQNAGYGPLTIDNIHFADAGSGFSVVNAAGLLGQLIAPGASVMLRVRFDPARAGAVNETLTLASDAVLNPQLQIPVTGDAIRASPTAALEQIGDYNFGGAAVGGPMQARTEIFQFTNRGQQDLQISDIALMAGAGNYQLQITPAQPSFPRVLKSGESVIIGATFRADRIGLIRASGEIRCNDPANPAVRFSFIGTGFDTAPTPRWGNDFIRIETPELAGTPALTAVSDRGGNFNFFLPPQTFYRLSVFDPETGLIGVETGTTPVSGQSGVLGSTLAFLPSTAPDSDGDGLPDDIEFALGTDPNKSDTDGDGVDDFVAVQQGLDPVGASGGNAGIVGRVPGLVYDYALLPDPQIPTRTLAYVANFLDGLSIIDVSQPANPLVLGQIPAPRVPVAPGSSIFYTLDASEVAVDPTTHTATIGGNQGYWFADVSDPAAPKLLRAVVTRAFVTFPVAWEGVSYVFMDGANGPAIFAFDSLTGEKINSIDLANFRTIQSVAHDGNFIYVLHQGAALEVIEATRAKLISRGSLNLSSGARTVFAANGRLLVANITAGQPPGQPGAVLVDVADPDHPKILSGQVPPGTTGLNLFDLIADSAGLGVTASYATVANSPFVQLLDLSDPQKPDVVIASLPLPFPPNSGLQLKKIRTAGGLAYFILNNQLIVFNYRNNDANNQPPTVDFQIANGDADPARDGIQLIAGRPFSLRVNSQDDTQVREVELLLNGQVVQRSRNFPFAISAVAPEFDASDTNVVLQVRATDRGGNSTLSTIMPAELVREAVPPQLLEIDPSEDAQLHRGWQEIRLRFSEPLSLASEALKNFPLTTANGTILYPEKITVELARTIFRLTYPPLEPGDYRLALRTTGVTDFSGNPLAAGSRERRFSVGFYSIWWITDLFPGVAGNWMNPTNWSLGRVPRAGDHVLLSPPRTNSAIYLVSLPGTTGRDALPVIQLAGLTCSNAVHLNAIGPDLRIDDELRLHAATLSINGALTHTRVIGSPDAVLAAADSGIVLNLGERESIGLLLESATLTGPLLASGNFLSREGLEVHGEITLTNLSSEIPTVFGFLGEQALAGDAVIRSSGLMRSDNGAGIVAYPGSRLTITPAITMSGSLDLIAQDAATLIHQGTFLCNVPTRTGVPGLPVRIAATGGLDGWIAPPEPPGYERSSSSGLIVNEGSIIVEDKAELQISGGGGGPRMSAARSAFINHGVLRANSGGRIRLSGVWSSDETRVEAGASLWMDQAVLLTPPGQTAIFNGPGRWLSTGEFRGGSVTLTDGAVLEAAPALGGVAINGDARVKIYRTTEFTGSNGDYNPGALACLSSFDLNGSFDFSDAGPTGFYHEPQPIHIGGHANFDFGANPDVYLLGTPEFSNFALTISSNVAIRTAKLTAGTVPGNPPANVRFENRGQIIIDAPDHNASRFVFYANSGSAFTNSGVIHVGRAGQMNFALGATGFPSTGFHQTTSGRIVIDIAGIQRGANYGWANFNPRPALDGTLRLNFVENFVPAAGQQFDVLTYDARPAPFSQIEILPVSTFRAVPTYKSDTLSIQIEP